MPGRLMTRREPNGPGKSCPCATLARSRSLAFSSTRHGHLRACLGRCRSRGPDSKTILAFRRMLSGACQQSRLQPLVNRSNHARRLVVTPGLGQITGAVPRGVSDRLHNRFSSTCTESRWKRGSRASSLALGGWRSFCSLDVAHWRLASRLGTARCDA